MIIFPQRISEKGKNGREKGKKGKEIRQSCKKENLFFYLLVFAHTENYGIPYF